MKLQIRGNVDDVGMCDYVHIGLIKYGVFDPERLWAESAWYSRAILQVSLWFSQLRFVVQVEHLLCFFYMYRIQP